LKSKTRNNGRAQERDVSEEPIVIELEKRQKDPGQKKNKWPYMNKGFIRRER